MSDIQEQKLYDAFVEARAAMIEAEDAWRAYYNSIPVLPLTSGVDGIPGFTQSTPLVSGAFGAPISIEQKGPTCIECGKPYFSIPRMGIYHVCSKV